MAAAACARACRRVNTSVCDFTPYTAACALWRSRACCRAALCACVHFVYSLLHVRERVLCVTARAFASVHSFAYRVMFMQVSERADCRSACVCPHVSTLVCISKHTCSCLLTWQCVCLCLCCFRMKVCEKQGVQLWKWILIRLNVCMFCSCLCVAIKVAWVRTCTLTLVCVHVWKSVCISVCKCVCVKRQRDG